MLLEVRRWGLRDSYALRILAANVKGEPEMKTPRDYWQSYVDKQGGPQKTAARLGIPYSSIACICNGSRGIGKQLARRMSVADPSLDQSVLVWVTSVPADKKTARAA